MSEPPANPERIQWGISLPVSSPEQKESGQSTHERGIDWGSSAAASPTSFLEGLIGLEDAFEHTPLIPGEKIAFCKRDQVAYHIATW